MSVDKRNNVQAPMPSQIKLPSDKENPMKKNKITIIAVIALVAGAFWFMYPRPNVVHTYGNVSFSAPGEWKVDKEEEGKFHGIPATTKFVTNEMYSVEMVTMQIPAGGVSALNKTATNDFLSHFNDAQDVQNSSFGDVVYSGAWHSPKGKGNLTQGAYVIMDSSNNNYTILTISGPRANKDEVVDIFKSIKYRDTNLYTTK